MSRSTYVYVVTDPQVGPVAAFTVKYELAWWLDNVFPDREMAEVARLRDGGRHGHVPVRLDPLTLEPVTPVSGV